MECFEVSRSVMLRRGKDGNHHFPNWRRLNAAKKGLKPPKGLYNIEKMLTELAKVGVNARVCHISMNLRGLTEQELVEGTKMGTITELSKWVQHSPKSPIFLGRVSGDEVRGLNLYILGSRVLGGSE